MAASVAPPPPLPASDTDDVLHLLFNQTDGILLSDQDLLALHCQSQVAAAAAAPTVDFAAENSPGGDSGSGSGGSSSGFCSADDPLQFDLDQFLSGADSLVGHAAYDLGAGDLLQEPQQHQQPSGGPVRAGNKRRKQRQQSQLPYSVGDLDSEDLQAFATGWDDADDDEDAWADGGDSQLEQQPEGRPGEPLLLTAEEARVARQLGASLPSRYPLTREEAKILRTVRRKIRNKISAKNSRAKKQEYVRGLELRVKGSSVENAQLRERCSGLEQQNRRLIGAVRRLQAFMRSSGLSLSMSTTAGKATGTGFFILCLSFALFLTPQLGPLLTAGPAGAPVGDPAPRPASGRRILAASSEFDPLHWFDSKSQSPATPPPPVSLADSADAPAPEAAAPTSTSNANASAPAAAELSPTIPHHQQGGGGGGGGEDDAPPREQDLADRDL